MKREQVFDIIDAERRYQDATYPPSEVMHSSFTRLQTHLDTAPHLMLLEIYVRKAHDAWLAKGGDLRTLQQIAKIAALAVRALERCAGAEELLEKGLR